MLASAPDLLRLVAVPAFAWAAWRDVRTRRVPNRTWYPLAALGALLLAVEFAGRLPLGPGDRLFLLQVAISVGFVVPLSYVFWRIGGFGGADAKAFMTLALLFPTYPVFYLPGRALPLVGSTVGVFSMTILTNTVLLGAAYPLALGAANLARGETSPAPAVFLARRVPVARVERLHGRLFETRAGTTRRGLDLDALRMYLRWRGSDLDALRGAPAVHRDPASVDGTHDPTDGAVAAGGSAGDVGVDGGRAAGVDADADADGGDADVGVDADAVAVGGDPTPTADVADPWAAAAFLDSIEGSAYGTTPEALREGLEVLVARERVWVSPGIPFIVPTFLGLVVALTYGDLLTTLLRFVGIA
jgi:preflagellin peptidase FlaK